jgi:hypothetical protein
MNERIIWDFVSKAREFAVSDTPDGGKCFDQDVFHSKFAELIVQRTLEIVEAHTEIFQSDEARAMVEHIKHSVKTDLGVES